MKVDYDPAKDEANTAKHGISLTRAAEFGFLNAKFEIVQRGGETRIVAVGLLDDELHVLVFTQTKTGIRAISLRQASRKEGKAYENYSKTADR